MCIRIVGFVCLLFMDLLDTKQTKVKVQLQAFSLWFWRWRHEKYAHCLCSHTPPAHSKPDEQVPDCSVSEQAAPTAEWVEARGERSRGLANIPPLQLSLRSPHPPSPVRCCCCCCCSVLSFFLGQGAWLGGGGWVIVF